MSSQTSTADRPYGADACPKGLWWVLQNKEQILALHSSTHQSKIFPMECSSCELWFQNCMFSNNERKADYPTCRWCQTELDIIQADQFDIHRHIHCNQLGAKRCGKWGSLEPPKPSLPVFKPETRLADVAPTPEVEFVLQKKKSQKERKAEARTGAQMERFG